MGDCSSNPEHSSQPERGSWQLFRIILILQRLVGDFLVKADDTTCQLIELRTPVHERPGLVRIREHPFQECDVGLGELWVPKKQGNRIDRLYRNFLKSSLLR